MGKLKPSRDLTKSRRSKLSKVESTWAPLRLHRQPWTLTNQSRCIGLLRFAATLNVFTARRCIREFKRESKFVRSPLRNVRSQTHQGHGRIIFIITSTTVILILASVISRRMEKCEEGQNPIIFQKYCHSWILF